MVKLKFANNFGVEGDTIELVHEKIFKMSKDNIPSRLAKIPNEELLDLYVSIDCIFLPAMCRTPKEFARMLRRYFDDAEVRKQWRKSIGAIN